MQNQNKCDKKRKKRSKISFLLISSMLRGHIKKTFLFYQPKHACQEDSKIKKTCFLMIFPKKEVKEYVPVTKNKKKNTSILMHHIPRKNENEV